MQTQWDPESENSIKGSFIHSFIHIIFQNIMDSIQNNLKPEIKEETEEEKIDIENHFHPVINLSCEEDQLKRSVC